MKRSLLLMIIIGIVISACSKSSNTSSTDTVFPTPTSYYLFLSKNTPEPVKTLDDHATPFVPTVSNFFEPIVTATPLPSPLPLGTQTITAPVRNTPTNLNSKTISIYNDSINPNWEILNSERTVVDPNNNQFAYEGTKSIKITPGEDFSPVFFAIRSDSPVSYPRDQVLGIEFKLNPGKAIIEPKNIGVTVIGSNQYTYYVPGDSSVTNKVDPVFPETRLYYLGINQMIPPQTWVDVTVWMDSLIYDPVYKNVTGFYIKNNEDFRDSFYVDDVRLILLNDQETASLETTPSVEGTPPADGTPLPNGAPTSNPDDQVKAVQVNVDPKQNVHPISSMIYGVSNASADTLNDLKAGMNSWGGNVSSRFNWQLGNAWNTGRDGLYTNTDLGSPGSSSSSDRFIEEAQRAGIGIRITLPTLGWVAKNNNPNTCSFPQADGSCGDANKASCLTPGELADPYLANVPSDVNSIVKWVQHLLAERYYKVDVFAMDNEPELWGITHYDVHPKCTTYQEILDTYLAYAVPVRQVAPKVKLAGPVTSGWEYYWSSAAGASDKEKNGNQEFLPWFLDQIKKNDTEKGVRTIDVLDIHYFPEGLNNQDVDTATATHRMRATRSLWDPTYADESPIQQPVNLIPRMKEMIAKHYSGLELGISAWNFGADKNINGALAIADVLGIFGRENIYYANYQSYPPKDSPGAFAFKMYTNYDGYGNKFGSQSVQAQSDNPNLVSAYASLDEKTGQLHLMIINKHPKNVIQVKLNIANFKAPSKATLYQYSRENLTKVIRSEVAWPESSVTLNVPPYSINHYILQP